MFLAALSTPTAAQNEHLLPTLTPGWCATGGIIEYRLEETGFEVFSFGVGGDEVTRVWVRPSGSWIITQSFSGETCIRAKGEVWRLQRDIEPAQYAPRGAPCLPHEIALKRLEQEYGEHKIGIGIGPTGKVVFELFTSESGTWTMLATTTNGLSCIVASGNNWTSEDPVIGKGV